MKTMESQLSGSKQRHDWYQTVKNGKTNLKNMVTHTTNLNLIL